MPHPLLIFSQSDFLIHIIAINLHIISYHIIIGFLINVQVQGQHPHQWAPFQIAGLLHAWQISLQTCLIIALSFRCRRWRFGFVTGQVLLAWSIVLRTQELYTRPHDLKERCHEGRTGSRSLNFFQVVFTRVVVESSQPPAAESRLYGKQHSILYGKQCRSRSVGLWRSQLIWIYTVCKGRVYPGSAGQERGQNDWIL